MNYHIIFLFIISLFNYSLPVFFIGYIQYFICKNRSRYGFILPIVILIYVIIKIIIFCNSFTFLKVDYKIIGSFSLLIPIASFIISSIQYYIFCFKK